MGASTRRVRYQTCVRRAECGVVSMYVPRIALWRNVQRCTTVPAGQHRLCLGHDTRQGKVPPPHGGGLTGPGEPCLHDRGLKHRGPRCLRRGGVRVARLSFVWTT